MAEVFKFFNSAPGDERWHTASDFADYFGSVLSSGVLPLNENFRPGETVSIEYGLSVRASFNSMRTFFSTVGKALILGYSYEYTGGGKSFTHRYDSSLYDRIDRIVLRLDLRNQERSIKAFIKEGVASNDPQPPELTRNATIYELSLAQVRVRGGQPYIDNSDIIDERANEDVCGIVQSLITVPTSVFQQQFDNWFDSYKNENKNTAEAWLLAFKQQAEGDADAFATWLNNKQATTSDAIDAWQAQEQRDYDAWLADLQERYDGEVAGNIEMEVIEARGSANNLRERLDADFEQVNEQIDDVSTVNAYRSMSTLNALSTGGRKRLVSSFDGNVDSVTNGATTAKDGDKLRINLTTAGLSRVNFNADMDFEAIDNTRYVDLIMSCDDWDAITKIAFYIIPDKNDLSKTFGVEYKKNNGRYNKPHLLRAKSSDYAPSAGLAKPMIVTVNSQFSLQITTTRPCNVALHTGVVEYTAPPVVMIQFDDNNRAVYYYAVEALKKRGIPATWYLNSGTINETSAFTWDMAREVQKLGWAVGNHTQNHINLRTSTIAEVLNDVQNGAYDISVNGLHGSEHLAAPFNDLTPGRALKIKHAVKTNRVDMLDKNTGVSVYGTNLAPPGTQVCYVHGYSVTNTDSIDVLMAMYNNAKVRNLMMTFVFHQITPTPQEQITATYSYNDKKFAEFLDALIADGAIFATVEDFYNAFVNPDFIVYGNQY